MRENVEGVWSKSEGERRTVIRGRSAVTIGRGNEEGVVAKGRRKTYRNKRKVSSDNRKDE